MRFILLILFTFCFHNVFCQKKNQNKLGTAYQSIYYALCENYDTTYIKKTRFDYVLVLGNTNYLDTYTIKNENKESLKLQSNLSYNVGVSFGYKMFFLGYSFNINNLFSPNSVNSSELSFTFPTNLLNLEMSYFNNKGKTYIIGYSAPGTSTSKNYSFEGLNTKILNVELFCFLNHKRYSNGAAYSSSFDYKQQKSAGSIIAGLSYTKQNFYFDLSQLPADVDFFSNNASVFNGKYDTFFAHGGYGYNFVFHKNWLTNFSVILKTGIKINEPDFILGTRGKMAVAYNRPSYYFGLNCDYNTNFNIVTNSIGNFNIYMGYRF